MFAHQRFPRREVTCAARQAIIKDRAPGMRHRSRASLSIALLLSLSWAGCSGGEKSASDKEGKDAAAPAEDAEAEMRDPTMMAEELLQGSSEAIRLAYADHTLSPAEERDVLSYWLFMLHAQTTNELPEAMFESTLLERISSLAQLYPHFFAASTTGTGAAMSAIIETKADFACDNDCRPSTKKYFTEAALSLLGPLGKEVGAGTALGNTLLVADGFVNASQAHMAGVNTAKAADAAIEAALDETVPAPSRAAMLTSIVDTLVGVGQVAGVAVELGLIGGSAATVAAPVAAVAGVLALLKTGGTLADAWRLHRMCKSWKVQNCCRENETRCGEVCCGNGQTCLDPESGTCECAAHEDACGSVCCAVGKICMNPFTSECGCGWNNASADCACGDGVCDASETSVTCAADCRCGDARCDAEETWATCAADCHCGNAVCDADETLFTCAADCRCGNALCDPGETAATCAADCRCGNAVCDAGETSATCPADCHCGNGGCDMGETAATCAADCRCGDGVCDAGENAATCAADCRCGNGVCDSFENAATCAADCPCGNGVCEAGENAATCAADCHCGNGVCDAGETSATCAADCHCGNGICEAGETTITCAGDCRCGNSVCEAAETSASCPQDCGPTVTIQGGSVTAVHFWSVHLNGTLRCELLVAPGGWASCPLLPPAPGQATLTITRTSPGGTTCPTFVLGGGASFASGSMFPACFGSVGTLRLSNSATIVFP